jgi:hypothetical protein
MNFESLYKPELSLALNNSDTSVLYTSTRRQVAIRQAEEEFIDLTECVTLQSTVACSCNVSEYDLGTSTGASSRFVRLAKQGVEYHHVSSGGRLRAVAGDDFPRRDIPWLNRNEPGWRESTTPVDMPTAHYIRDHGGQKIVGLKERPDVGSSETARLLLPHVARPDVMASTGDEPFTVNGTARTDLRWYHKALPKYAAYKLLPLIGDMQGAQAALQEFLGYVQRYLQDQRPKGGTHVQMGRNYYRESRRTGAAVDRSVESRFGRVV